jgi:hypothetical protein
MRRMGGRVVEGVWGVEEAGEWDERERGFVV